MDNTLNNPTITINDDNRPIDFILVSTLDKLDEIRQAHRETFELNLTRLGLILEEDIDNDVKVRFLKIHAPLCVLYKYAEITSLHKAIQINDWTNEQPRYCGIFDYNKTFFPHKKAYFTSAFSIDKKNLFLNHDLETFFTPLERSRMVAIILKTTPFVEDEDTESQNVGIYNLKKEGTYKADYPLHSEILPDQQSNDLRILLQKHWASFKSLLQLQPLDHIKDYFGSRYGFYFCWLEFYTWMLLPIGVLGLLVTFYGFIATDLVTDEICDKSGAGNFTMCPTCDRVCPYWKLHHACDKSKQVAYFQNDMTVLFAVAMAIWSVVFTELWKRREAKYAFRWHLQEYGDTEILRPAFQHLKGENIKREMNVHGELEPILPFSWKCNHKGMSIFSIVFMLILSLTFSFLVLIYRSAVIYMRDARTLQDEITNVQFILVYFSPALINLIIIYIMGNLYRKLAYFMTNYEVPRTSSDWEDSFIFKCFVFGFVNNYSTLFYIAFIKGNTTGRPGKYNHRFLADGKRLAQCGPGGCYTELCTLLVFILVGKPVLANINERFKPYVMKMLKNLMRSITGKNMVVEGVVYKTRWAKDFSLPATSESGLVDEYLEMVIQFGFVTMFAVIFPPAAFFCMINNLFEIRIDAWKLAALWRRPVGWRAAGIGIWYHIFEGVTNIAIITNAMIIAITSNFINKQMYSHYYSTDSLQGFMEFSLSIFNVSDFEENTRPKKDHYHSDTCMYFDFRHPPTSPEPYEKTKIYYEMFGTKCVFIFIFVGSVALLSWIIRFVLPDMPNSVKMQLMRQTYVTKLMISEGLGAAERKLSMQRSYISMSRNQSQALLVKNSKSSKYNFLEMRLSGGHNR